MKNHIRYNHKTKKMKSIIIGSISLLSLFFSCNNDIKDDMVQQLGNMTQIYFVTADSIKICGDLYKIDKAGPIILLFHQGGSNSRGEYGPIIPKLIEKGYNVLAIDQRMGGQYYGYYNRTLTEISDHSFSNPYSYCDAYNNLEGALNFAISSNFTGKKILWGSSYSASLAVKLANENSDIVHGVLAFSPASGGPMKDCQPEPYFENLDVPLLVLRPPNEMKNESAQDQFLLAKENGHQTFVPHAGVHGSSMLVEERVGSDVSETWNVVLSFLEKLK